MDLKEYEALLHDVETRLDRLRALYEQYFQGIERLEPTVPRKEIERRIQLLKKAQPRNTALRFRTQQVVQKYTTYLTYWSRIARQIEEGTYRRDVLKARQRRQDAREARRSERDGDGAQAWEIDIDVDVAEIDVDAEVDAALSALEERRSAPPPRIRFAPLAPAQPSRPSLSSFPIPRSSGTPDSSAGPVPARASSPPSATFRKPRDPLDSGAVVRHPFPPPQAVRPPPVPPEWPGPPAARPASNDAIDIRRLYERYVEARRRNNESGNVRYETLEKSIKQMLPKLQEKHRGRRIDFEVVVKDGKVGLKPVPK